jgi:hypothetical protein
MHDPGELLRSCRTHILRVVLIAVASLTPCLVEAASDQVIIDEVLGSWRGDDRVQFVELRFIGPSPTLQTNLPTAALEFVDGDGCRAHSVTLPTDVVNGVRGARVLIATKELERVAGLTADFIIEPGLIPVRGGRICYAVPFGPPRARRRVDCVSYGEFSAIDAGSGVRTSLTPDNRSLQRVRTSDRARDRSAIASRLRPTPQNNLNQVEALGTRCGNGHIDPGEECDGRNLGGETCRSLGFLEKGEEEGEPACDECHFDVSECTGGCGNGRIDPGEECDGAELGGPLLCSKIRDASLCTDDCTLVPITVANPPVLGGRPGGTDCFLEWEVDRGRRQASARRQRCIDGDPRCDVDGAVDGACAFRVRACFNREDSRRPSCRSRAIGTVTLRRPLRDADDPIERTNAGRLLTAISTLESGQLERQRVVFDTPLDATNVCTPTTTVVVPLRADARGRLRRTTTVLKSMAAEHRGRRRDLDTIRLECRPGP